MAPLNSKLLDALRCKPAKCNLDGNASIEFILHFWTCFTAKLSDTNNRQFTGLRRDYVQVCDVPNCKRGAIFNVGILAFIMCNGGDAIVDAIRFVDANHAPCG